MKKELNMTEKKRFYLEKIATDIIEEKYDGGELESTGCGLNELIGKAFVTVESMMKYLSDYHGLSANKEDYNIDEDNGRIQTEKQVANHSEEQNGGWMEPTAPEIDAWKEGRGKLYCEHWNIYFHKIAE
jgi:hypothetical protein